MSLILQINPSLEKRMRQNALQKGIELNQFIVQFLELNFPEGKPKSKRISQKEAELLQKIDLAIPIETWEQYHNLRAKRQNATINAATVWKIAFEMACINDDFLNKSTPRQTQNEPIRVVRFTAAFGFPAVAHVRTAIRHIDIVFMAKVFVVAKNRLAAVCRRC